MTLILKRSVFILFFKTIFQTLMEQRSGCISSGSRAIDIEYNFVRTFIVNVNELNFLFRNIFSIL
jgi:hypothetical protein